MERGIRSWVVREHTSTARDLLVLRHEKPFWLGHLDTPRDSAYGHTRHPSPVSAILLRMSLQILKDAVEAARNSRGREAGEGVIFRPEGDHVAGGWK